MSRGHFINGLWHRQGGPEFSSLDPATGRVIWQGGAAREGEVDAAVRAARGAFESWRRRPAAERIEYLNTFAAKVREHKGDLAQTISADTGKPLWESLMEAEAMANKISISIAAMQERRREMRNEVDGVVSGLHYRAIGVFAVLGPFNLPGHIPNGHIVPALLSGNTVIFKPSEMTPAVGEATATLWEAAGLPDGVFNMIQGGRETGGTLVRSPDIDGLLFTGSLQAGRALHALFAGHPEKMMALELGGNNPLVVWDAADLSAAAALTLLSAFITAGQRCTCARRLIVGANPDGDRFLDHLAEMVAKIRIGAPTLRPEPFYGPVITVEAAERLLTFQRELIRAGARSIVEMAPAPDNRALLTPGLMDVTSLKERGDGEWFGPMLQVIRVPDFESALAAADRTAYGLAAGLLSDDPRRFDPFRERVRAGHLVWNRQTTGASSRLPFGGLGLSGNHRPSGYFAVDYCSDPVASLTSPRLSMPAGLPPGLPRQDGDAD